MWRREWRLAPFGSFSRRNSSDTAAEMESGLNGDPSGLANIRSRSARYSGPYWRRYSSWTLAVFLQRRDGRHRQAHWARLLGFRPLKFEQIPVCVSDLAIMARPS